jgi:uncharacterized protein (UPF0332 family)
MSLHADLLIQAEQLAQQDPRRPKQANLRRAVSSAYYALFHLLTSEASALYAEEPGMASRINRTHNHTDIKEASLMIARNKLPKAIQAAGRGYTTPPDLKRMANGFLTLQEARHEADYDLSRRFRRQEALGLVESARQAFDAWYRVRRSDDARLYLACFLLLKRWDKDAR